MIAEDKSGTLRAPRAEFMRLPSRPSVYLRLRRHSHTPATPQPQTTLLTPCRQRRRPHLPRPQARLHARHRRASVLPKETTNDILDQPVRIPTPTLPQSSPPPHTLTPHPHRPAPTAQTTTPKTSTPSMPAAAPTTGESASASTPASASAA
jgi:hypothetical protein